MPVRPVAERRQSDDRSYQQENHDEFGIFNDEGDHGIHSFVTRTLLHLFCRSAGKYQPACRPNVSCVTEDSVVLVQAGTVKAFPPPTSPPPDFWRGFFIPDTDAFRSMIDAGSHGFCPVKTVGQTSAAALPGA
jgi:hypothetical protein